jgi:predicted SnoaL-like aldol condensation-catalyzing enzyme
MFPNLRSTIELAVEDGDKIAVAFTATGTHKTLKKATTWRAVNIYRFVDGKIVEVWIGRDDLSISDSRSSTF